MLTRRQIEKLANKNRVSLFTQDLYGEIPILSIKL